MQNRVRSVITALVVALIAPFVLALLLQWFTPGLSFMQTPGQNSLVLSAPIQISAYFFSFVLFFIAGLINGAFMPGAKRNVQSQRPHRQSPGSSISSSNSGDEEGTVKWFNVKKGFGFILRENGEEVFVHFRSIEGQGRRILRQGQRVQFTVIQADKGPQANNVSIIGE